MAHGQFFIVIYNESEASVRFSCFFTIVWRAIPFCGGPHRRHSLFEIAMTQTFQSVIVQSCSPPSRLVNPSIPAVLHHTSRSSLGSVLLCSWPSSLMERFHALIKGDPPGIVCFCDLVAICLRFHSDLSALLQSVFFTMRVMQISSPLPSIMLPRVAQTIVKYHTKLLTTAVC